MTIISSTMSTLSHLWQIIYKMRGMYHESSAVCHKSLELSTLICQSKTIVLFFYNMVEFFICNNYIDVFPPLVPVFASRSVGLSVTLLFSGLFNFSSPQMLLYPYHHDNQTQMRLSSFLPLRITDKLAALHLWFGGNNPKRDKRQLLQCLAPTNKVHAATYQATDRLFGLISWCFVSWVYMANEQKGKYFDRDKKQTYGLDEMGWWWTWDV